jgi:hypothetical protein
MCTRYLLRLVAFAAVVLVATPASAKYSAPPIHDVFGISELVVVGEISGLQRDSFDLEVEEVVVGDAGDTVRIRRFQDWTCAHRWAPYKKGQRVLVFASRDKEGAWRIRSAGGEGEMPLVGDDVVLRGPTSSRVCQAVSTRSQAARPTAVCCRSPPW